MKWTRCVMPIKEDHVRALYLYKAKLVIVCFFLFFFLCVCSYHYMRATLSPSFAMRLRTER